ncbi:CRISPR system precrRNA processing endoribonuclease RAMP protein Cas6 [Dactylosporangium sp. NPDC049525]|uniref:CRISPR system precrRNA processing endoribonuclease RAMP protein Cas6 n=1 Tax=Dactylosporangium sp. NPDC049525 TaxID=3154730 RepID=UPI00343EFF6A
MLDDARLLPAPPADVKLGDHRYQVVGIEDRSVTFGELLQGGAATAVRMEHRSPATLSVPTAQYPDGTRGPKRYLPLPEPVIIYRGLARRWNTHAPAALRLPDTVLTEISARVALAEHDIRTVVADLGDGKRPGFVGRATYVLAGADRDDHARTAFTALSGFAGLCGVGSQTSHGLGAVTVTLTRTTAARQADG